MKIRNIIFFRNKNYTIILYNIDDSLHTMEKFISNIFFVKDAFSAQSLSIINQLNSEKRNKG